MAFFPIQNKKESKSNKARTQGKFISLKKTTDHNVMYFTETSACVPTLEYVYALNGQLQVTEVKLLNRS
jgi:hypothetical protein